MNATLVKGLKTLGAVALALGGAIVAKSGSDYLTEEYSPVIKNALKGKSNTEEKVETNEVEAQ